jgi:hypothetical protein
MCGLEVVKHLGYLPRLLGVIIRMFNLQYPPKPIIRRKVRAEKRIQFNSSGNIDVGKIKEILDTIEKEGGRPEDATMCFRFSQAIITYDKDEGDFSFEQRKSQHNINLQQFEKWKVDNAEEIHNAMSKKRHAAADKAEKDRKEIEYLEELYSC